MWSCETLNEECGDLLATCVTLCRLTARRFSPPWAMVEITVLGGGYGTGQQLAYLYFEDEPGRRSTMVFVTKNEAIDSARNYAAAGIADKKSATETRSIAER